MPASLRPGRGAPSVWSASRRGGVVLFGQGQCIVRDSQELELGLCVPGWHRPGSAGAGPCRSERGLLGHLRARFYARAESPGLVAATNGRWPRVDQREPSSRLTKKRMATRSSDRSARLLARPLWLAILTIVVGQRRRATSHGRGTGVVDRLARDVHPSIRPCSKERRLCLSAGTQLNLAKPKDVLSGRVSPQHCALDAVTACGHRR